MADGGQMNMGEFIPSPANTRAFRDALGCFATGVTLVTTQSDSGPMGFAANSFAALSLDPPLVLWSPAKTSRRFGAYLAARDYAIHVLPHEALPVMQCFISGGPGFDGLDYRRNDQGIPVLDQALARFDCRQHATHDGGDHVIIVGEVLRVTYRGGAPLVFHGGRYGSFTPGA